MSAELWPYNLPIFRRFHEAASPDGRLVAKMVALEVSMSSPTMGVLSISNGVEIDCCNPSFLWSDDSRFLAVPQWRHVLGLQLRQRLLLIDTRAGVVFASRPLGWFLQPKSFDRGVLVVEAEPTHKRQHELSWRVPEELQCPTWKRTRATSSPSTT